MRGLLERYFPTTRHWDSGKWFAFPILVFVFFSLVAGLAQSIMLS